MKKILNLEIPDTDYFYAPPMAYMLSVLNTFGKSNEKVMLWIISNFIDICIDINLCSLDIPDGSLVYEEYFRQELWYGCPFISSMDLNADFVRKISEGNFTELVKMALELDYFVYADLNRKYIPNYNQDRDVQHNLLIYGYDEEEKIMNIADYFRNHRFTKEVCQFSNIDQAYKYMYRVFDYEKFSYVNLFRYRSDTNFEFSIDEVKRKLIDYIEGTNLMRKYHYQFFGFEYQNSKEIYYGITYYDALIEILHKDKICTPKTIQLLVSNKMIMKKRIELLNENIIDKEKFKCESERLLKETVKLRNLILKLNLRNASNKILDLKEKNNVSERIKLLKEQDYILTRSLLENI